MSPCDGIINLFKPTGITSAKALYRVRAITGVRKSGHAGALDPAADGVLLVCQGKATKLVEKIMDLPKLYRATARLDVTSVSLDADSPLREVTVRLRPTADEVRAAMAAFEGLIDQVPPRVSAIKLDGVPAYKTVGRADAPPMPSRKVRIDRFSLSAFDWPTLEFEIGCGRGTYVRSLIRDLGGRLGTGGCLTSLRRLAVGPFKDTEGWTFDRLRSAGDDNRHYLIPLAQAAEMVAAHDSLGGCRVPLQRHRSIPIGSHGEFQCKPLPHGRGSD